METTYKIEKLKRIYEVYEEFLASWSLECKKYCAECCTCNVTLTTLEAYYLLESLDRKLREKLTIAARHAPEGRFSPACTFNEMARLCLEGREPPEEKCDPDAGPCVFLTDKACPAYPFRPFGCRCLVSSHACSEKGHAQMAPLIMSVNDVMMQMIEHLDAGGFSGNLADVVLMMASEKNREAWKENLLGKSNPPLILNRSIKALMVPPEHREKVMRLIRQI